MTFELHPNLSKKSFIIDLPLCHVLLEDNQAYPWIFLVPRRPNISRIMDLNWDDQIQLLKELDRAQKIIWEIFKVDQLNVAAIGNKTPQLHIHVIGRKIDDPAWPGTVWDHANTLPYTPEQKSKIIEQLVEAFKCSIKTFTHF